MPQDSPVKLLQNDDEIEYEKVIENDSPSPSPVKILPPALSDDDIQYEKVIENGFYLPQTQSEINL